MHNIDLILTLAAGFSAALALGYITQRRRSVDCDHQLNGPDAGHSFPTGKRIEVARR